MGWLNEQFLSNNNSSSTQLAASAVANNAQLSPQLSVRSQFKTKPTFLVLTSESLLLFEKIPQTLEDWLQPTFNYSLLTTRLITQQQQGGSMNSPASLINFYGSTNYLNGINYTGQLLNSSESNAAGLTFLTRHGTPSGVLAHLFCCLTRNDFKNWSQLIERQIYNAVYLIRNADFCELD